MHRSRRGLCDSVVPRLIAMGVVMAGALAGCGGGAGDSITVSPGFATKVSGVLSISATSLTVVQGQSGTVTLTLTRKGQTTGAVNLKVFGVPETVTQTFDPPSFAAGSSSSSTLTLAVGNSTVIGTYSIQFLPFIGTDTLAQDAPTPTLTLTVTARPGVTVSKAGSGSGTVTSNPAGINCGGACNAQFDAAPVTLTAVPAAGSAFASWGGACVGTALTCTFTPPGSRRYGNVQFDGSVDRPVRFALAREPAGGWQHDGDRDRHEASTALPTRSPSPRARRAVSR